MFNLFHETFVATLKLLRLNCLKTLLNLTDFIEISNGIKL